MFGRNFFLNNIEKGKLRRRLLKRKKYPKLTVVNKLLDSFKKKMVPDGKKFITHAKNINRNKYKPQVREAWLVQMPQHLVDWRNLIHRQILNRAIDEMSVSPDYISILLKWSNLSQPHDLVIFVQPHGTCYSVDDDKCAPCLDQTMYPMASISSDYHHIP